MHFCEGGCNKNARCQRYPTKAQCVCEIGYKLVNETCVGKTYNITSNVVTL